MGLAQSSDAGSVRRSFLLGSLAVGLTACSQQDDSAGKADGVRQGSTPEASTGVPELPGDPFTLGVASGDPLPDSLVLWTRLLPTEGPVPERPVPVRWQVATDEQFTEVAAEGVALTDASLGNSVHAVVDGLEAATSYRYRFAVGDWMSPVGRTRTAPAPESSPESVRFAVANCQAWQSGYFAAYRHLAEEPDLDAVLFMGDYIYELESSTAARPHGLTPPATLEEYRAFYELNNSDEGLRAALAAHPWIFTWDDHEVEDNYGGDEQGLIGRNLGQDPAAFPEKRAAAYRAWWEHMPIRTGPPVEGDLMIYRGFRFGELVSLSVVDNRQHRSPVPDAPGAGPRPLGGGPQPPEALDPGAQMLGEEQEEWLLERLAGSGATWNVLAQQSIMAEMNRRPDLDGGGFSLDSWDGYVAARKRLMDVVSGADGGEGVENFVSLGGDIHTSAVTDLLADPTDPSSPVVGTELIGPSVSALELLQPEALAGARSHSYVKLYDIERRGYLLVEFTPEQAVAAYRWVDDALDPESGMSDGPVFVVADGRPGAEPL